MPYVERDGELVGLASMIADLIEGNLITDPNRAKLLVGPPRRVAITVVDLDANVAIQIGNGIAMVSSQVPARPDLQIFTDSLTLLDLPNAKLLGGLPSLADPVGRAVVKKMFTGGLKIRGITRVGLLSKVQRLLSVA